MSPHGLFERSYAERDKHESAQLADEYVRNFTTKEVIPGIAYEYALCQRFLPEITLAEVNALARQWTSTGNRVVMVGAPRKPGVTVPDEARLAAAIARAGEGEIKPWVDTVAGARLLEALPAPGLIVKTVNREAYGITEWELSNGINVVLKPTTNKQDEIVFRATSPGGTSLASGQDFIPASTAGQVISAGGVGKFNAIELRNLLAGKVASARPLIGEMEDAEAADHADEEGDHGTRGIPWGDPGVCVNCLIVLPYGVLATDHVIEIPEVGGLHHRYEMRAA